MTLKTDIDQIAVDAGILHSIVQGPVANVTTAGGPVKSVAKAVSDAEAAIISGASSYLVQVQSERDTVLAAKALAESAAASAGSVMQQDLSAIDRTVFASTTLVDAFLYDTSKDSDGGAWRKRCAHTSWENETLSGNWLGSAANEAAARAISGATTGSYYYDTTAAVFYKLNAGSGVTQVYRGNVRQFPAQVLISVGSARVVIWDLTQAGCPMWMVFTLADPNYVGSATLTTVAMSHGQMVSGGAVGISNVSFPGDSALAYVAGYVYKHKKTMASRNSGVTGDWPQIATGGLVSSVVNKVAITVLPAAPVDVATGLPMPTIAVATNGGVTVIKDDGNVWDIVADGGAAYSYAVAFTPDRRLMFENDGSGTRRTVRVDAIPTADVTHAYTTKNTSLEAYTNGGTFIGDLTYLGGAGSVLKAIPKAIGTDLAFMPLRRNPAVPANGMIAYVTKDYNSGWQIGAIKGAWLADTVAETLTGADLITNGDFSAGTTGWTAVNSGSIAVASGELTVTNGASNNGTGEQAITTVVGKTYVVRATARIGTATPVYIVAGTTSGSFNLGSALTTSGSNAPLSFTFTATGTTTYIGMRNTAASGATGIYDNISCRLADVDRSVKVKGLQAFGSLTKAAVASGAALMGYSGWSTSNFLEQPYNSDLDFGTGDFCAMGWANITNTAGYLFDRYIAGGGRLAFYTAGSSGIGYTCSASVSGTSVATAVAAGLHHFVFMRMAGVLYIYTDAALYFSAANTANCSNTAAPLVVGAAYDHSTPSTGFMALWRFSATAPSIEQIKRIYETERALFEANAQCCLAGTSNAVTALAYDDETDLLHVGTSYGRSAFKGLVRVASEATPVGSIVALAAGAGVIAQAGASGADVYVPAYTLREELLRDAEQMARFGQNLIAHDFTATASQTDFVLPVGWEIVAVYQQGALKRETTSWTRSFDGFLWKVVLGTGATVSDWISILAKRV